MRLPPRPKTQAPTNAMVAALTLIRRYSPLTSVFMPKPISYGPKPLLSIPTKGSYPIKFNASRTTGPRWDVGWEYRTDTTD